MIELILPRTTEHSQNIYWHFQILTANWNTQMISIILTPFTSNLQNPTQIITQYSDHNALYFHSSLIFNSLTGSTWKVFLSIKVSFSDYSRVRPTLYLCVQTVMPLQSTNHGFQVSVVCHMGSVLRAAYSLFNVYVAKLTIFPTTDLHV